MRSIQSLVIISSLLCFLLSNAIAQESSAKRDRLLEEVGAALAQKNYGAAIPKMQALYALSPDPAVLFNIGIAYEKWGGHCPDALKAFTAFLDACGNCNQKNTGLLRADALRKTCGPGRLEIKAAPGSMSIEIDGKDRGVTPLALELEPGEHVLKLSGDDGSGLEQQVFVGPDTDQAFAMTMAPKVQGQSAQEMSTQTIAGWSLLGGGMLSFTGVVVTLVMENETYSEYQETIQPALTAGPVIDRVGIRQDAEPLDEDVTSLKNTAKILAGLGVALTATGAYLLLTDGPDTTAKTAANRLKGSQSPQAKWSLQVAPNAIGIHGVFH